MFSMYSQFDFWWPHMSYVICHIHVICLTCNKNNKWGSCKQQRASICCLLDPSQLHTRFSQFVLFWPHLTFDRIQKELIYWTQYDGVHMPTTRSVKIIIYDLSQWFPYGGVISPGAFLLLRGRWVQRGGGVLKKKWDTQFKPGLYKIPKAFL